MSCVFCKSLAGFTIDALVLVGSEQTPDDLGDPEKHFAEAGHIKGTYRAALIVANDYVFSDGYSQDAPSQSAARFFRSRESAWTPTLKKRAAEKNITSTQREQVSFVDSLACASCLYSPTGSRRGVARPE